MDHHPFGWIESDRVGIFDTVKPVAKFRAEESRSGVSGIDVQPNILRATLQKKTKKHSLSLSYITLIYKNKK